MKTFKKYFSLILFILLSCSYSYAQLGVNNDGSFPNPSSMVDVKSTNKGMLIPRMTTAERDAISTPEESLFIFNTTTKCFEAYVNGAWNTLSCPAACTPPAAPSASSASGIGCTSFTANWSASTGATSYLLDVATDAGFTSFVGGYSNLNVGNVTSSLISGLTASSNYYYRVRATTACTGGNSNTVSVTTDFTPLAAGVITGTTPVCQGENGVSFSVGAISGATSYTWTYSGTGFSIASGSGTNSITADFSTSATSGNLTVSGTNVCGNGPASEVFAITINNIPSGVSASASPNPICENSELTLTGAASGATSWSWSGPNGFSSTAQNPTISNITSAGAGIYSIIASNTCGAASAANTASVSINSVPTGVTASASPNPICEGATLTLSGNATGATSWSWTGPNGFTSTSQNPTISNITVAELGVYSLTASNSCGAATVANTTSVTMNTVPTGVTASASPNPICEGTTLTLTGGATGATTWSWSGPNGYSSSAQSPTLSNITSAGVGIYSLTASNACGSATAANTASVSINPIPSAVSASATPNPICEGTTLTLTGGATGATSWSWSGPNGYSSSTQSPTLSSITTAAAGVYSLTASNACGSATAVNTASVTVNTAPTGVTASASPNPMCVGSTLTLTGSATGATSWSWSGPNSYSAATQNPTLSNITTLGAGVYALTATNSCGSAAVANTASIVVNSILSAPTANAATVGAQTSFDANWTSVVGATSYFLDVATDNGFTTFVSGFNNLDVGNVTTYNVPGLTCEHTYYYRLRAYNSCTSSNSSTITAVTPTCLPTCNAQVFMVANMNVGTRVSSSLDQSNDGVLEKYCYNDIEANCTTYGALYQWSEAMQIPNSYNNADYTTDYTCDPCGSSGIQGICPSGYHIPTDLEWSRYEYCLDNTLAPTGSATLNDFQTNTGFRGTNSGDKMKATSSNSPAWNGTNISGFNALPAGCLLGGVFFDQGIYTSFWSATENDGFTSWNRDLYNPDSQSYRFYNNKTNGFSVRCVQN